MTNSSYRLFFSILLFSQILLFSCIGETAVPEPILPIPSPSQVEYQKMEFNGFVHFNMNTFSNMEWGFGDEDPQLFNPTALDCEQWVQIMKDAGMKGVIITAKHHDGFCLWPSQYTEHSVKNSGWENGEGDVVRELSDACKKYGLKFGVYLSPWDRNHKDYGSPIYLEYFRNQLTELLTNYGEIFEVWFDGANGGDGYYGGARETRKVDKLTYYDWEKTYELVYKLQPDAIIFSDAGPGARWIGNEKGYAYPTTWSMLNKDSIYPGMMEYATDFASGQENGSHWVPGESDVSIRPGWYYHPYEDHKVKSLTELTNIYYNSIGQNSTLLLNFPVDKRGLIHEADTEQIKKLTQKIKEDFENNLINEAKISSNNVRGKSFKPALLKDGDFDTYWAANEEQIYSEILISFDSPIQFNRLLLQEYIHLGQRIKAFSVEIKQEKKWINIAEETTVGYKRLLKLATYKTDQIKIIIEDARACPILSEIGVFYAKPLLSAPKIVRYRKGSISMKIPEPGPVIHYTTDGTVPNRNDLIFKGQIRFPRGGLIRAIAIDGERQSEMTTADLDMGTGKWFITNANDESYKAIDGMEETWWSHPEGIKKDELIINMGEILNLKGFTYLPTQQRWITGYIEKYEFYTSMDGKIWTLCKKGEFSNILNSPVEQRVQFASVEALYIKLKVIKTVDGNPGSIAEFGIITK